MTRQVRLLKVLVQTVWVEMDDETGDIAERVGGMVAVPAADWSTFYERHTADFAALQQRVAAESNGHVGGVAAPADAAPPGLRGLYGGE